MVMQWRLGFGPEGAGGTGRGVDEYRSGFWLKWQEKWAFHQVLKGVEDKQGVGVGGGGWVLDVVLCMAACLDKISLSLGSILEERKEKKKRNEKEKNMKEKNKGK